MNAPLSASNQAIGVPVAAAAAAPVARPVGEALVSSFVRWLADALAAPVPQGEALPQRVEPADDGPVAWPAGGAPDGLVRLGISLSAAVSAQSVKAPPADETDDAAPAAALPPVAIPAAVPIGMPLPPAVPVSVVPAVDFAQAVPMPIVAPARPVVVSLGEPVASSARRAPIGAASVVAAVPPAEPDAPAASPEIKPPLVAAAAPAPRGAAAVPAAAPIAVAPHDAPEPIDIASGTPQPAIAAASIADAAAASVKLHATPPAAWQAPLLDALGDHVRVQLSQRSEQAVIRLDPPLLGTVEIVLRHEAGVLQVQLSASHTEVQRQLLHIADTLRQDLSQRQYGEVSVQVASPSPGDAEGRQRPSPRQPERAARPGRALSGGEAGTRFMLSTAAE